MHDNPQPDVGGLTEARAILAAARLEPEEHRAAAQALLDGLQHRGTDPEALVVALHAVAWIEHEAMANRTARSMLTHALEIAEENGLVRYAGDLLVSRIAVLHELGDLDEASADLVRASELIPPEDASRLELQQATLIHAGGGDAAADAYRRLHTNTGAPAEIRAKAANNLAHIEAARGRFGRALWLIDDALVLAAGAGPTLEAYLTHTRAWLMMQAGHPVPALAGFRRARELFEANGVPLGEHLAEYSDALAALRLLPEALRAAREASALLSEEAPVAGAEAALRLAWLQHGAGDDAGAHETATAALSEFHRLGRTVWASRAELAVAASGGAPGASLTDAADSLAAAGLHTEAVAASLMIGLAGPDDVADRYLRLAAQGARRMPVMVRLQGHRAAAELARRDGRRSEVLRHCRRGLAALAAHRATLPSAELRVLASGHGVELARAGLRALLPEASPARVLGWLERMRAAAIGGTEEGLQPDDVRASRLRAVHAELAAARASEAADPTALLNELAELEDALRLQSWTAQGGTVHPTRPVGLGELRNLLQDRALVEYAELDGRLLAVVVAARRPVRLVDLGPSEPVARLVSLLHFGLRRLAVPGVPEERTRLVLDPARAALDRLRDVLLGPLDLPPGTPLVVAPVGALQQVPWPALHAGPVAVAPSASVWARTATGAGGSRAGGVVLVAGPGLPGAQDEVARLRAVHPDARVLTGGAASAPEVLLALRGADLAHLSCHGTVRSDSPTFSSLQMSDGPLTLHEILTGAGAPARVVLAACDSAVEATYPGDEALGFVSALLGHGADAVLASTVLVPDLAAVPLMVGVHERLATGATVADALHAARATVDTGSATGLVASCAFTAFGAG